MGCMTSKTMKKKINEFPSHGKPGTTISTEFQPCLDGKKLEVLNTLRIIDDVKVTSQYNVRCHLGSGAFSEVFSVECMTSKHPYAIKVLDFRSNKARQLFRSESEIMKQIKHKNIVKFVEVIESETCAFIVMELATGGDLSEKIQTNKSGLLEAEALRITRMIMDAVVYLHRNKITHRDLKPENVLFYQPGSNSRIIVTDFGLARHFTSGNVLHTFCGTFEYLSPEIVEKQPYTHQCDIWAVGVMVYEMLCGVWPFQDMQEIATQPHVFNKPIWNRISTHAKDFIDKTLVKNPDDRLTAEDCMKHAWMKGTQGHKSGTPSFAGPRSTPNGSSAFSEYKRSYPQKYLDMYSCTDASQEATLWEDDVVAIGAWESASDQGNTNSLQRQQETSFLREQLSSVNDDQLTNTELMGVVTDGQNYHGFGGLVLPESTQHISKTDLESTDASTTVSCDCPSMGIPVQMTTVEKESNHNLIHVKELNATSEERIIQLCPSLHIDVSKINTIISESSRMNCNQSESKRNLSSNHRSNKVSVMSSRSKHCSRVQRKHHDPRTLNWVTHVKC